MLPNDYLRKLRQDLREVEAQVGAKTRREAVLDDRTPYVYDQTPPDDED